MMKVVVACHQALMREGLSELLKRWDGVEVIGVAPDVRDAARLVARAGADVLLVVRGDSPKDDAQAIAQLRTGGPGCKIVLVETRGRDAADDLGADRRVGTGIGSRGLVRLLWETCGHAPPRADETLTRRRTPAQRRSSAPQPLLTRRECDVVRLVCAGLTSKAIARRLGIAEKTVKNHLSSIYQRVGLTGRAQLAVWGVSHGFALDSAIPHGEAPDTG